MRYKHTNRKGFIIVGPAIATLRFFDTLNKIEKELDRRMENLS